MKNSCCEILKQCPQPSFHSTLLQWVKHCYDLSAVERDVILMKIWHDSVRLTAMLHLLRDQMKTQCVMTCLFSSDDLQTLTLSGSQGSVNFIRCHIMPEPLTSLTFRHTIMTGQNMYTFTFSPTVSVTQIRKALYIYNTLCVSLYWHEQCCQKPSVDEMMM